MRRRWQVAGVLLLYLAAMLALPPVDASFTASTSNSVTFTASSHFYRDTVLADGPAAYWRLSDGGGTVADAVGSSDGRVGPVKGVAGPLGVGDTATRFSRDWQSVAVPDAAALRPVGALTMEAWVRPATGIEDWATALGKTSTPDWSDGYGLYWHQGALHAFVGDWGQRDVSAVLPLDIWSHIVASFNGSDSFTLYVDGQLVSTSASVAAATVSTSPVGIGSNLQDTFSWRGDLANVAVYSTALSGAQAADHAAQTTSYGAHVLADNPVAFWRLAEPDVATTATDAAGSYTGRYGFVDAAGALGSDTDGGATFDGYPDGVVVPDSAALNPAASITVEAWVKPATGIDDFGAAMSKATDMSWNDGYALYWSSNAGGQIAFYAGNLQAQSVGAAIPLDTWSHVVGTYDGATLRLYVNGTLASSAAYGGGMAATSAPLFIGAGADRPDGGMYSWLGSIDDVAIYASVLSPVQIARHYTLAQ